MDNIVLIPVPLEILLQSIRGVVKEEIKAQQTIDLQEKLLSPAEACIVFQPSITKPTLKKWTDDGFLIQHRIGSRVFYKYSELLASLKTLKKYKKPVVTS